METREPTVHSLDVELTGLEERMNTKQQEYKTDIARLAEDAAKRETRLTLTFVGIMASAVTIIGVLIAVLG